jgi:hypothetical protein
MEKEMKKNRTAFEKLYVALERKEDDTQKTTTSARIGKKDQGESKYKEGQREKAPCHKQRWAILRMATIGQAGQGYNWTREAHDR